MKKLLLIAILAALVAPGTIPPAEARVGFYANTGCCYGGGYGPGYYNPYYAPYYQPYYVAPPPVVYAVPQQAPVVYAAPPQQIIVQGQQQPMPAAAQDPGASPTFIDSAGRTCRHYQTSNGGPPTGTACLQPDGSWRATTD